MASVLVVLDTIITDNDQFLYWKTKDSVSWCGDWIPGVWTPSPIFSRSHTSLQVLNRVLSQGLWRHITICGDNENLRQRFLLNMTPGAPLEKQEYLQ